VQVGIADQFRDESLAHRRIESSGAAEQESEDADVPELDGPGDGQDPKDQGETSHRRLGGDEELALVEMVGGEAGPGQQQELRPELQGHHQADRRSVVIGELGEHQPVLPGPLYPGADVGDESAGCPDPIVESSKRPENAGKGKLHGCSGRSPSLDRPNCGSSDEGAIREDRPKALAGRADVRLKSVGVPP